MARKRRFSDDAFGPTIERLMAEAGLTYRSLAEKTSLSAGYLNHLVHGNRPVPSDDVIKTLARALGVEAEHFREYRLARDHRPARAHAGPDRQAVPALRRVADTMTPPRGVAQPG